MLLQTLLQIKGQLFMLKINEKFSRPRIQSLWLIQKMNLVPHGGSTLALEPIQIWNQFYIVCLFYVRRNFLRTAERKSGFKYRANHKPTEVAPSGSKYLSSEIMAFLILSA